MYEAFYGLRDKPFNLTPDPKYLYLSEKHKEAFAHLLYGIKNRSGFVMVSGEIGTGKTTICRTLLGQLDEATEVAFIFNPSLSPIELIRSINSEFGLESKADTVLGLIQELNKYLLDATSNDKNCVLVIDEAQNLAPQVLEQVRLLSNLETESKKLLQIVLIGQPELAEHLALPELRQLNQRITARYHLEALGAEETLQYIAYRLRVAGGRRKVQFDKQAVKQIHRYAAGTPRVINAICDRCLLIGYTQETRTISPAIVRQAIREVRGKSFKPSKTATPATPAASIWPTVVAAGAVIAIAAMYFFGPVREIPVIVQQPASDAQTAGVIESPHNMKQADAAIQPEPDPVEEAVEVERTPFETMLHDLTPESAREGAAAKMIRLWNMADIAAPPADDSIDSLTEFANAIGLRAAPLNASIEQLKALGLPAFIKVYYAGDWVWLTLAGVDDENAAVSTAERRALSVPIKELSKAYQGNEAVVLWRDPNPNAEVLKPGSRGEAVRELQRVLLAAGLLDRDPNGTYDAATSDAVKGLQRRTGLNPDGLAGEQTRMALSSWMPQGHVPALAPRTVVARIEEEAPAAVADEPTAPEQAAPEPQPETAAEPKQPTPDPEASVDEPVEPAAEQSEEIAVETPVEENDEAVEQPVPADEVRADDTEIPAEETQPDETAPATPAQPATAPPVIEEEDLNPPGAADNTPAGPAPTAVPVVPVDEVESADPEA